MDYVNDGKYGFKHCNGQTTQNCFIGSDIQQIIGLNTTLEAKDHHKLQINSFNNNNINNNSKCDSSSMQLKYDNQLAYNNTNQNNSNQFSCGKC